MSNDAMRSAMSSTKPSSPASGTARLTYPLSQRLATLTEAGILEKRPYREATSRARFGYYLTEAGQEVKIIVGALQQWGDAHRPHPDGPLARRVNTRTGRPLRVAFVDDRGEETALANADIGAPVVS
ncbi:winged helix-turn-helix transcriptional regulator [Streptomyces camponoticapitis]|uniref:winged helix-turn-helix transcriptional regulator n=1 Tax=Streptomyces camponoticapitis TaxID=1616125 RepID=UPI001E515C51|nr:winged helix-turn-helix transcriptional regulator [Streptomyces camponoticapitis]